MNQRPIGIFDSGIGGLTVLRQIERLLGAEDIIYFGDTARLPYGNKSQSTIIKFTTQNILFLLKKKVKIVVVACNTSTSLALAYLKGIFPIPLLGVIAPGVDKALRVSENKVGVIGTRSTIASRSYQRQIRSRSKQTRIYAQACPLFVPLVEEGILKGRMVEAALRMYLEDLRRKKPDVVILGCTHYPLLKPAIAGYLKNTSIVDSAREVALYTRRVLKERGLLNKRRRKGRVDFYVTDEAAGFARSAKLFLKRTIPKPRVVNV